MTDPAAKTPDLTKQSPRTAGSADVPKSLPRPWTIDAACGALALVALGALGNALLLRGSSDQLKSYLTYANAHAKKPVDNFDADKALSQLRSGSLLQGLLFLVVFGLLIFAIRRTRSASPSRWALLVVAVFTQIPFYIVPVSRLPIGPQIADVVMGAASIIAILLIFIPPMSQRYFRDSRQAALPPERRGQPRPGGLGALFGPRRPAAQRQQQPAQSLRKTAATTRPAGADSRARSKVRSDADATARGADLARARAKAAGKSRRTAD